MWTRNKIFIELMRASQMHPVQRWYFTDKGREIVIGRSTDSDIVLPDSTVSRRHARIIWDDSGCYLESLGRNGCYAGDKLVRRIPLKDCMRVRLGKTGPYLRFGSVLALSGGPQSSQPRPDLTPNNPLAKQTKGPIAKLHREANQTRTLQAIALGPAQC